jgi:hypothetical protein
MQAAPPAPLCSSPSLCYISLTSIKNHFFFLSSAPQCLFFFLSNINVSEQCPNFCYFSLCWRITNRKTVGVWMKWDELARVSYLMTSLCSFQARMNFHEPRNFPFAQDQVKNFESWTQTRCPAVFILSRLSQGIRAWLSLQLTSRTSNVTAGRKWNAFTYAWVSVWYGVEY